MNKNSVKEFVEYALGEKCNMLVKYANGKEELVIYRGFCYMIGKKDYSAKQLLNKLVRTQDNVTKFITNIELQY